MKMKENVTAKKGISTENLRLTKSKTKMKQTQTKHWLQIL